MWRTARYGVSTYPTVSALQELLFCKYFSTDTKVASTSNAEKVDKSQSVKNAQTKPNLSCVLYGLHDLRMENREVPVPKSNQLLIRVHTVGICRPDVHYWTNGCIGHIAVKEPLVLGRESCGTVIGWGNEVKGFKKGDRVAVEPGLGCREFEFSKAGRYALAVDSTFYGARPADGALSKYIVRDAEFCYKLPDHVLWEAGSFIEPLSIAVCACRRASLSYGQKILIFGAGPVGLMTLLTAKATGISKVVVTDLRERRLERAKELGADHILNVANMKPAEVAEKATELLGGYPEVAFECSGASPCVDAGLLATKNGGLLMLVGIGALKDDLLLFESAIKEIEVRGVRRYANCYPTALNMVSSGAIKLESLTRAFYKLEEAPKAFDRFLKGDVVKVFILCDKTRGDEGTVE